MYVVLMLVIVCVIVWGLFLEHRVEAARFREQFPPIDDQEFLRRCGPNVRPEVALRVRRIVSEQLGVEYACVYPEQSFANDLGCC